MEKKRDILNSMMNRCGAIINERLQADPIVKHNILNKLMKF